MNYLAHARLSFDEPGILAGNMISDFVKGKKKFDYPDEVRKGIELHRSIDEFTDNHPVTKKAKFFFRQAYGLYAGAFVDIAYDHFLARDKDEFPADTLSVFTQTVYQRLSVYEAVFPEKFVRFFHHMKTQDWLYNYQYMQGACNSFEGLVRRAAYLDDYQTACNILREHHAGLERCYHEFFPDIKVFARERLRELQTG
ncbi:MAG: ACP phosphodiesterase [Puia sp.]|nr:ACP phosphodiesterase [Puia sp.]